MDNRERMTKLFKPVRSCVLQRLILLREINYVYYSHVLCAIGWEHKCESLMRSHM